MLAVQQALIDEGALAIQTVPSYGYTQKKPVNLRKPDLSLFTGEEIAMVDDWLQRLRPMNAKQISDYSHKTAAWQLTTQGEIINPNMGLHRLGRTYCF